MKKLVNLISMLLVGFCIATVLSQTILLGVIWAKAGLTEEKRFRILALLYDIDLASMRRSSSAKEDLGGDGQALVESRVSDCWDIVARHDSFRASLASLVALENLLRVEQERSKLRETDFDHLLAKLEQQALDESLREVRLTLEQMQTRQAKTQLMRMLDDGAMDDVVAMVVAMPIDKRKKIFSEFKSNEEEERLHEILRQLRKVADVSPDDGGRRQL